MQQSMTEHTMHRSLIGQIRIHLVVLLCLFVVVVLLGFLVSTVTLLQQDRQATHIIALHDDINAMMQAMVDQETGLRGYITTDNPLFLQPYQQGRSVYQAALRKVQDLLTQENFASTARALPAAQQRAQQWESAYVQPQLQAMQSGNIALPRSETASNQGKALFDQFRQSMTRLQDAAQQDADIMRQTSRTTTIGIFGIAIICVLLLIGLLWQRFLHFTGSLHRQLSILEHATLRLSEGEFTSQVPPLSNSELDHLGQTFNMMAGALQQQQHILKQRDILEAVLTLNKLLTSTLDIEMLLQNFLYQLQQTLHIELAAIYMYDQAREIVLARTTMGIDHQYLTREFTLGEGLIGQVALHRRPLFISAPATDITQGIRTKTVLGSTLPTSLYHLPLLHGEDLLGVLVAGSLYTMNDNVRNVLDVISSNLSAVLSNSKAYLQIQQQASELATRSREQEQNNMTLRIQRDELRVLNTALEESNQARDQFLTMMTHELRTPLTAIIGFGQLVLRDNERLEQRHQKYIERMIKNGQHLLNIVNDALDMMKIESGRMNVALEQLDVHSFLNSLWQEFQQQAADRGLELRVDISPDVHPIQTDAARLRQIIINLLSNALKFTEQGYIALKAARIPAMNDEVERVAISVEDTGIGIAPDFQAHIFDVFYQVDSSITRKAGGTGLGLSIVQQLTLLLGGTIEVSSQPGQGSTFTLLLPLAPAGQHTTTQHNLSYLPGLPMPATPGAERPTNLLKDSA